MNRELTDLHAVRYEHIAIHERCLNWARYVRDGRHRSSTLPMFKFYRQVRHREFTCPIPIDSLDGHAVEKAVGQLPEKHRDAIRWHYVHHAWIPPNKACRHLGVTRAGLSQLVHDARSMLRNRSVTK